MIDRKKSIYLIITTGIVIIGFIFFIFKIYPSDKNKELQSNQINYTMLDNFENNLQIIATGIANGYSSDYFIEDMGEIDEILISGIHYNTFGVNKEVIKNIYKYLNKSPNKEILSYYGDWDITYEYSDNLNIPNQITEIQSIISQDEANNDTTYTNQNTSNNKKGIDALLDDPNFNSNNSLSDAEWDSLINKNKREYKDYNGLSLKYQLKDTDNPNAITYVYNNEKNNTKKCIVTIKYNPNGIITDINVLRGDGGNI